MSLVCLDDFLEERLFFDYLLLLTFKPGSLI